MDLSGNFLPVASLLAGLSGSLHCLGMCGGLVTASCHNGKDVLKYQVGRLLGYLILGSFAFAFGYVLKGVVTFHWAPLVSGLSLGILFIFWGIRSFHGKKAEVPLPGFLRKAYQYSFRNFVSKAGYFRSFVVGLISIMLPCGLLYGLMVAALALGDYQHVIVSLLFFWIGTLPAMIGAPQLIKKVMEPFRKNLPTAYAVLFIVIGVATIAGRLSDYSSETNLKTSSGKVERQCH